MMSNILPKTHPVLHEFLDHFVVFGLPVLQSGHLAFLPTLAFTALAAWKVNNS